MSSVKPVCLARSLRRLTAYAAASVTLAVSVAACGSSSHHGSSPPETSSNSSDATHSSASRANGIATAKAGVLRFTAAPTRISESTPLPRTPPKGKRVVFLGTSEPSDVENRNGFLAGARALGWNASSIAYDPADPSTFDTALTSALAAHPFLVAEAGTPIQLISASVLAAYRAAHVPIAVDGVYPCRPTSTIIGCTVAYPVLERQGAAVADWFIAQSNGSGRAVLESVPGYPILGGFTVGFERQVAHLCPGCVVKDVDMTLPQVASGQVLNVVVSALKANSSDKYVFFDDGDFAVGVQSALNAASITGVTVGGQNMNADNAAGLRAGTESVWTGQSNYYGGYALADAAARYSVGASGATGDELAPFQLVTRANVGSTTVWNEPSNALAQFEALWKVPRTPCPFACG